MIAFLLSLLRRRNDLSSRWLASLRRQSTRVEYHGPYVHRSWK